MDAVFNSFAAWLPAVAVAPVIGSFMGVLIQRLPENRPVVFARSACDHCGHRLAARDLVPLLSFVVTRGRCRYCHAPIGLFAPAVELAATAVALWAGLTVPEADLWPSCVLGWLLLTLSWIDSRTMLLPDALTLPLLVIGLIATYGADPAALSDHTLAAVVAFTSLTGVAWLYRRLRGRDGLGGGDPKLFAGIGAWVGLALLPLTLFLAASLGLAAAGAAALMGRRMTAATAIPFGPFLAMAAWLLWLYGGSLDDWMGG